VGEVGGAFANANAEADETPMPSVRRVCRRCLVAPEDVAAGRCLVSPSLTAHYSNWDGDPVTECGFAADGPGWWWPL